MSGSIEDVIVPPAMAVSHQQVANESDKSALGTFGKKLRL